MKEMEEEELEGEKKKEKEAIAVVVVTWSSSALALIAVPVSRHFSHRPFSSLSLYFLSLQIQGPCFKLPPPLSSSLPLS